MKYLIFTIFIGCGTFDQDCSTPPPQTSDPKPIEQPDEAVDDGNRVECHLLPINTCASMSDPVPQGVFK